MIFAMLLLLLGWNVGALPSKDGLDSSVDGFGKPPEVRGGSTCSIVEARLMAKPFGSPFPRSSSRLR